MITFLIVLVREGAIIPRSSFLAYGANSVLFEDPSNVLTLSLLVLRVGTNDHYLAVSADDLALLAHRLY